MLRPVCVPCMTEYRPQQNGVLIEDVADRLWAADLWECPECGVQIVTGFSKDPVAERWQPHYPSLLKRSLGRVNS